MPQSDYPRTDETLERAKVSAALERWLNVPVIGCDVNKDGILQLDVRRNADLCKRPA